MEEDQIVIQALPSEIISRNIRELHALYEKATGVPDDDTVIISYETAEDSDGTAPEDNLEDSDSGSVESSEETTPITLEVLPENISTAVSVLATYGNKSTLNEIFAAEKYNDTYESYGKRLPIPEVTCAALYSLWVDKEHMVGREDNLLSVPTSKVGWFSQLNPVSAFKNAAAQVILQKGKPEHRAEASDELRPSSRRSILRLPPPPPAEDAIAVFNFKAPIFTVWEHRQMKGVKQTFDIDVLYRNGWFYTISYDTSLDQLFSEIERTI